MDVPSAATNDAAPLAAAAVPVNTDVELVKQLITKKRALDWEVARLEKQIYSLETEYLKNCSSAYGSMLQSVYGYITGHPPAVTSQHSRSRSIEAMQSFDLNAAAPTSSRRKRSHSIMSGTAAATSTVAANPASASSTAHRRIFSHTSCTFRSALKACTALPDEDRSNDAVADEEQHDDFHDSSATASAPVKRKRAAPRKRANVISSSGNSPASPLPVVCGDPSTIPSSGTSSPGPDSDPNLRRRERDRARRQERAVQKALDLKQKLEQP